MSRDVSRRRLLSATGLALSAGVGATAVGATRPDSAPDPSSDSSPSSSPDRPASAVGTQPALRWTETFDQSPEDAVVAATTTDAGLTVGVGSTGGQAGPVPWAFAIDRHGRGQWQTPVDLDGNPRFLDVAPAGDGGVVVGGERRPDDGPNEGILVGIDAEGAVQWQRRLDAPLEESVVFSVVRGAESGYVVAGGTRDAAQNRTDGMVARVDVEGETQWSNNLTVGELSLLWSVAPSDGGPYVGSGVVRQPSDSGGVGPVDGWLVGVDADGNRNWSGTHRVEGNGQPAQSNFLRDVVATGDGYLGVGYVRPPEANGTVAWVLATDASGSRTGQTTLTPNGAAAGLRSIVARDGEFLAVGSATPRDGSSGFLYLGVDASATPQWHERQRVGDASQALGVAASADGGVLTVGTSTVPDETATSNEDVAVTKLGGDPRPASAGTASTAADGAATPTATATGTATETAASTATPAPTPVTTTAETATATPRPADAADEPTATADGPGFGFGAALAALGAGVLFRSGGRDGEGNEA